LSKDTGAITPLATSLLDTEAHQPGEDEFVDRLRDEQLASLKDNLGFQQIRDMIVEKIDGYRKGLAIKTSGNEDFDAIGRKFLVSSLVATELEGVLAQIDAAADAVKNEQEEE
jgi:hypothetical protein